MTPAGELRAYRDNYEYLEDELCRVDRMLKHRILNQPTSVQLHRTDDQAATRAVFIARDEVEWLLDEHAGIASTGPVDASQHLELASMRSFIGTRIASSLEAGIFLALPQLCSLFRLSSLERDIVLLCLAPELRRKYDRLYAYVQDDITRKRPSVDLVLDLLCASDTERWSARQLLMDGASLERSGILTKIDDPQSPSGSSGLAQFLKLDPRICGFLLGSRQIDARLVGKIELLRPPGDSTPLPIDPVIVAGLSKLVEWHISAENENENLDKRRLVLHWHGPPGVGKRDLALHLCRGLNSSFLRLDAGLLLAHGGQAETLLRLAFREALLQQSVVFIEHADVLLEEAARPLLAALRLAISEYGWLVLLSSERPWTQLHAFPDCIFHSTALPVPEVSLRAEVWKRALGALVGNDVGDAVSWPDQLASQFRLTPGQIQSALELARVRVRLEPEVRPLALSDLTLACRNQSNQKLRDLAVKVEPHSGWSDLILPSDKMDHLREIASHVQHRHRVFETWGFGKKLSRGKGLSVLFTGPSGTGKTMAAEVLAGELGLDLYKVDLANLVSKYIGETEKNLARVFAEAETSNAILLFDEADALFGKRTEVSDAHDRFANIETSYLLQKMEEYEGMVIMTTNLRENMDEAFARRIRFIVEFPFPDEAHRLRLWKTHFATALPVSSELNYEYLAQEFSLPGGNIKNISVSAAFMAAADGGKVVLEHILHGSRREYEKMGKLWRGPVRNLATKGDEICSTR